MYQKVSRCLKSNTCLKDDQLIFDANFDYELAQINHICGAGLAPHQKASGLLMDFTVNHGLKMG